MDKKKIFYGALLALSINFGGQACAQSQSPTTETIATGSTNTDDCTNPEKKGSRDSTCLGIAVLSTAKQVQPSKMGIANGTSYITLNVNGGASCTAPWGATVPDGGSVSAFMVPSGTYDYAGKTWATECQEEVRVCFNGTLSGSYTNQSCDLQPVNGSCGSANGQYYTYPTTGPASGTLCNPEYTYGGVAPTDESAAATPANSTVTLDSTTNRYSWTCSGELGGSVASCQAFRRINGQCGSSANSCSLGSVSGTNSSDNKYPNYLCNCSTSGGVTTCTASPTGTQTCTGGYKDTTYNWQCTGVNTGSTASCTTNVYDPSKNTPVPPPCGPTTAVESGACPSGYTGTRYRTNNVDSCTNTVTSYGTWDESGCTASCGTTTTAETAACDAGYIGNKTRDKTVNTCTSTTTYTAWNTSGCTACGSTTTTETASCGTGYVAGNNKTRSKTVNTCTGTTSYGSWNMTACTPCSSTTNETSVCDSGYTGNKTRTKTVDSCAGTTTYGTWDTSACTVSSCTTTTNETASCGAGYTTGSTQTRTKTVNSCTGTTSYGTWDTSSCTPCSTTTTESGSCGAGYTAGSTQTRTKTVNSCTGTTSYGTWNTSSCVSCSTTTNETASCGTGYTASSSQTRTKTVNSCTGTTSYGTWDTSSCVSCNTVTTETAVCDAGFTGNKTRSKTVNSCTGGTVTYGTWNTSSCTAVALPTASGSFNKTTVASNGSATFTWSTSGATTSRNVDCWGTAIGGNYDGRASGSITVTFSGAGEGYCNVAAINSAGETGGFDNITVTQYCGPQTGTETATCDAGYSGNKSRTTSKDLCTNVTTYGTWNVSGCTPCSTTTTETAVCDSGFTGNKTRSKTVNICTGVTSYGTWNTSSCTAVALPTASGSFNKTTVASNGSATFTWSTSGATTSRNVDCWGTAIGGNYDGRASGSITVTFSGTGEGYCNVSAINAAGESGGFDSITVTAPVATGCGWAKSGTNATTGTIATTCEVYGSGPNPQGQKYQCTSSGSWSLYAAGNSAFMMSCT